MRHKRLLNLSLRGLTLSSKFFLIFFLAKFLEPRDVGIYGLLSATIGYGIYLVGMEFYTFSSRELISSGLDGMVKILKNQLLLYSVCYVVCALVLCFLSAAKLLPGDYLIWVTVLIFFEHLAQEINRILIALLQQLYASVVLFIRMGLWGLVVIATQWFVPETRTVEFVLSVWLVGVLLACLLGVLRISMLVPSWRRGQIDLAWLINGLKIALPFFVASIAVRGIATFDRFFVERVGGLEILGVYVLFIGVTTAVISFLDAGVVDFSYPKLIATARTKNAVLFVDEMRKTRNDVLALGGLLIGCCGLSAHLIIAALEKDIYIENIYILYWLLFATAFNALSIIPHLGLYALNKDQAIVHSQVFGFVVFLLVFFILSIFFGLIAVLFALCISWASILAWKFAAYQIALSKFTSEA